MAPQNPDVQQFSSSASSPRTPDDHTADADDGDGGLSLFFRMPAEIRNHIYELVVWSEWQSTSPSYFVLDRPLPSLFRANRQIRSEALDVFLLKNHFHVYTSRIGFKWLELLGKDVERFRFLDIFVDLQLREWSRYIAALTPLVSGAVEIKIRKAAASLSEDNFREFLERNGFLDEDNWIRDLDEHGVCIFRRVSRLTGSTTPTDM